MTFLIWDTYVLILAFRALSKGSGVRFFFLAWFPKEMRVTSLLSVCLSLFFSHTASKNILSCEKISAKIQKHCMSQKINAYLQEFMSWVWWSSSHKRLLLFSLYSKSTSYHSIIPVTYRVWWSLILHHPPATYRLRAWDDQISLKHIQSSGDVANWWRRNYVLRHLAMS